MKKLLIDMRTLKVFLVRAQKEKRQTGDKTCMLQKYMNSHGMLVEIRMIKAIPVTSQVEMRERLLEIRAKRSFL